MTKSGHRSSARFTLVFSTLAACCLTVFPVAVGAQAPAERRAVLVEPDDAELLERVRGQTGDLAWTLRLLDVEPHALDGRGLRWAQRLGEQEEASVVIWLYPDDGGWLVHVADVTRSRLLTRRIRAPQREGELAHSAGLEATALVIRSALKSLAEGGQIGVAPVPPPPEPASPAPAAQPPPSPPSAPPAEQTPPVVHRLGFALGWHVAKDVGSAGPRHGPHVRLDWHAGSWNVGFRGDLGLPLYVAGSGVEARLWRVAGMVAASHGWRLGPGWVLRTGLEIGTVVLHRSTTRTDAPLLATQGAWLPAPAAAAVLGVVWHASSHLRVRLELGADALLAGARFQVDAPDGRLQLAEAWPLQPWLALSMSFVSSPFPHPSRPKVRSGQTSDDPLTFFDPMRKPSSTSRVKW